jgi:beta-mannosidase
MSVSLDGEWQLTYFPEGSRTMEHPSELKSAGLPTISARVPGNVELDLAQAGVIDEPFRACNIRALRQFEGHEWWYTREFALPLDACDAGWNLVFGGLDTIATVWIDDVEVGRSANMLVEQRFDVSAALCDGRQSEGVHRIDVRLRSAVNHARKYHYDVATISYALREECLFVRKAAHMYGWDIMPRAVSAGIWRSVWLEERPPVAIEQLYYWTDDINSDGVVLGVRFQLRTDDATLKGYSLRFEGICSNGSGRHRFEFDWPLEFIAGGCRIPLRGAQLWWPKGYGDPNLYTVTARLCKDGQTLAERVDRVGIRQVLLERTETATNLPRRQAVGPGIARLDEPVDPASHFVFVVNGEPVFVRGSNWVPLDAFHSRDSERVERVISLFEDLGCNMIRCWGGNVYEDHRFFDLCDERGILVWQDFAFACARYPQTEDFLVRASDEAQAVVEKLRNHPSLALWCGDNEVDMLYILEGLSPEHNRLTREVLPRVVHRCDPYRDYVPSSPYVPPAVMGEPDALTRTPEQHLWGPRGYYKSDFYTHHSAHFIGEIGYHGCPNVSSIRRFISPEKLWPWQSNDEWDVHSVYHWQYRQFDQDRINLMAHQVREMFGEIPDSLNEFALASQIVQAEAKKTFIESTRLRKWNTSGILWWNVIDGWPQFSDAVVDYFFGRKLAYEYIRRVQLPVCVIVGESGAGKYLPVVICNDARASVEVSFRVWDADDGDVIVASTFTAPANQNWQVGRIRTYASDHRLLSITWEVGGQTFGNHYLVGRPPFSLQQYRVWLPQIASLPRAFDADAVAR